MRAAEEKPDVVGYIRVSTEEQARGGFSLLDQEAKLRKYAELHELNLVDVVDDPGASAKTLNRPGMLRVLRMLDDRQATGIVIAKLDRLTRKLSDWSRLIDEYFCERAGFTLRSVQDHVDTSTATGRMQLNLVFTIAQWEREVNSERTRSGLLQKIAMGERVGQIRYGYELDPESALNKKQRPGRLRENEREQAGLALILDCAKDGLTLRQICCALENAGFLTKAGKTKWHPDSVRKILDWAAS